MNEDFQKHPLIIILFFFLMLFAYGKFGPEIPFSISSGAIDQPLSVEGVGKVVAIPDTAKVSVGIEESGASLKEVQNSVNKKSQELVSALKELGVKEADIKTTYYQVNPRYDYSQSIQVANGYTVSTSYEIKLGDLDKLNELVVKATSVGANIVGGISFNVNESERKKLLDKARREAVDEAYTKAKGLADASGVTLGPVVSISEVQDYEDQPRPMYEKSVDSVFPVEPEIVPGTTEISVLVYVSYQIR